MPQSTATAFVRQRFKPEMSADGRIGTIGTVPFHFSDQHQRRDGNLESNIYVAEAQRASTKDNESCLTTTEKFVTNRRPLNGWLSWANSSRS